jgi:cell wall-associated NlpC family hydrolase
MAEIDLLSPVVRGPSVESEQRAAVVAQARSWIGTPYHNCADVKGAGVDCGMLLVRVFVDTGLCPPFDPRPYPADWHLHRSEERYLGFVFHRAREISTGVAAASPTRQAVGPGDVMVLRFGRCHSHGGIVTNATPLRIVHAYYQARRVVEEEVHRSAVLSDPARSPRFFSFWADPR